MNSHSTRPCLGHSTSHGTPNIASPSTPSYTIHSKSHTTLHLSDPNPQSLLFHPRHITRRPIPLHTPLQRPSTPLSSPTTSYNLRIHTYNAPSSLPTPPPTYSTTTIASLYHSTLYPRPLPLSCLVAFLEPREE